MYKFIMKAKGKNAKELIEIFFNSVKWRDAIKLQNIYNTPIFLGVDAIQALDFYSGADFFIGSGRGINNLFYDFLHEDNIDSIINDKKKEITMQLKQSMSADEVQIFINSLQYESINSVINKLELDAVEIFGVDAESNTIQHILRKTNGYEITKTYSSFDSYWEQTHFKAIFPLISESLEESATFRQGIDESKVSRFFFHDIEWNI